MTFQSTPLREGRPAEYLHFRGRPVGFNPRPCARGDVSLAPVILAFEAFQSTPLREGRLKMDSCGAGRVCFNPRPCARGDAKSQADFPIPPRFQSTPLREGRPDSPGNKDIAVGFNPRPCARGDTKRDRLRYFRTVSIHAPARGATQSIPYFLPPILFQSTPLREGRRVPRNRPPQ